ncbi:hypothetical protein WJX84_000208 [Apatococcus fuscideae]|uniref:Uncharacterized protein n=1 Tax=Apatococcus fuscideae TaxID=2026836 RepID=A0AAW1SXV0_9CHLO
MPLRRVHRTGPLRALPVGVPKEGHGVASADPIAMGVLGVVGLAILVGAPSGMGPTHWEAFWTSLVVPEVLSALLDWKAGELGMVSDLKRTFPNFQPSPPPLHWLTVVNGPPGQCLYEQQSPLSGAITVEQQQHFRVLRIGGWVHSIVLTEGGTSPSSRTIIRKDHAILAYMRVMVAAACGFLETPLPHADSGKLQMQQARVLCLGLGGGVLPMILQHYFGSSGHLQLSAVELDRTITHAATMHMGLDPHFGRHKGQGLHIRDAAKHVADLAAASRAAADQGQLQQPAAQYDCIMLDCFDNNAEVPSQFLAQAFISDCRQIVPEGGVLVANMINGAIGCAWRQDFGRLAEQMCVAFGPTFSIGIRDDNQQNAVLVAKRMPAAHQNTDFPSSELRVFKQELQQNADQLARRHGMPYNLGKMLEELYHVLPDASCIDGVAEVDIDSQ